MARGPSQAQLELIHSVLGAAAARYQNQAPQTLSGVSRAEAGARIQRLGNGMDRAAQRYDRRSARSSGSSGGGGGGFGIGDIVGGIKDAAGEVLPTALKVIDTPRDAVLAYGNEGVKWLNKEVGGAPDAPKSLEQQADAHIKDVVTRLRSGELTITPEGKITGAQYSGPIGPGLTDHGLATKPADVDPATALGAIANEKAAWIAANKQRVAVQQSEYQQRYEPSLENANKNFAAHTGYGQYVATAAGHFDKNGNPTDAIVNAPWGLNFAAGLAGDIAADPVARVMPAGDAERALGKAGTAATETGTETLEGVTRGTTAADRAAQGAARFAVGNEGNVSDLGLEEVQRIGAKLAKSGRLGTLTPDEAAILGERGGYKIAGQEIGGQNIRHALTEYNPLSKLRIAAMDKVDALSGEGGIFSKIRGKNVPFKIAARAGEDNPERAMAGVFGLRASRAEESYANTFTSQLRKDFHEAIQHGSFTDEEMPDVWRAVGGDRNALEALGPNAEERLAKMRPAFDNARELYMRETGNELPRYDNYLPGELTDEWKRIVGSGAKGRTASLGKVLEDFVQAKKIVPGSEFMGQVVPDLPTSGVMDWANIVAKAETGHDIYKTSLADVADGYARKVGNAIGKARAVGLLKEAGFASEVGKTATNVVNEKSVASASNAADETATKLGGLTDQLRNTQMEGAHAGVANDTAQGARDAIDRLTSIDQNIDGKFWKRWAPDRNTALDYHQNMLDSLNGEAAAARPQETAASIEKDASRSLRRVAAKVESDPANSARHLDASASYREAATWAKTAQGAADETEAQVATMRAQEAQLQGQLQEMGLKNDLADLRLSRAQRGKFTESLSQQTRDQMRTMFLNGEPHTIDPKIIEMQSRVLELTRPSEVNKFLEGYDTMLNWWKAWSLASPRFGGHLVLGHAWNNALAGVELSSYKSFFQADHAFSSGPEAFAKFAAKNADEADAYVQGREYVLGSAHDFGPQEIGQEGTHGTILPSQNNYLVRGTRRMGANVQHMMRTTLAMDTILHGGTINDAIDKIATYHFDYGDLTTFERTGIRRLVPFYTWTRRNLPLQLRGLATHPSTFAKYNDIVRNISLNAKAENVVPSYFQELGAFPVGNAKLQGSRVYGTATALPLNELTENWADPATTLSQVSPFVKTPIELWAGKQFFKGLPLTGKQTPVPAALAPILPVMKGLGLVKSTSKGDMMDERVGYVLQQFSPQLGVVQRQGGDSKYNNRLIADWINYTTGLNIRVNTPADKKSERYRRNVLNKTHPITIRVPNR